MLLKLILNAIMGIMNSYCTFDSTWKQKKYQVKAIANNVFQKQTTFAINKSYQPQIIRKNYFKIYSILHHLNCQSSCVIYLTECLKCKIKYVGKSETQFNVGFTNE